MASFIGIYSYIVNVVVYVYTMARTTQRNTPTH